MDELNNLDYASMPKLFHMDDYDRCMLLGDETLYCTFSFQLEPLTNNNSLWNIIKKISSDPRNYRHDIIRHGVCVTTSCSNLTKDIEGTSVANVIQDCYNQKFRLFELAGNVTNLKCNRKESDYPIDFLDIIVGVLLASYISFVIFASFYEGLARYQKQGIYEKKMRSAGGKLIAAFSIPNNWHRLTSVNTNVDAEKLRSIQGIRFYNMICVILCHTLTCIFALPVSNTIYTENITKEVLNMFLTNGNYAVQTFFVISGWLLSFHFFQMTENRKNIGFKYLLIAFINRYIRLTPTLAVMVAFEMTWLLHMGSGPLWETVVVEEYKNCRQNWWTNFLYINNYVNKNNMCLHQTWYIAADTQLYLFSLFIVMLMWKKPQYIKAILSTTIIIGLIIPGVIAFYKNYDIVIRQYPEIMYNFEGLKLDVWHDLYSSGYSSITGYTIGVTFGYIFYKSKNKTLHVKRIHVVLWWFLSFGLGIFVILIAFIMYQPNYKSSRIESALYWAFGKNIFALSTAIAIFGFTLKIGWFARWFCEWKAISILGRLTYSTYIVHVPLMRLKFGYQRMPLFVNDYIILQYVLGDIVWSYLAGTILCLCLEMPVSALQKLMVPQLKNKTFIKQSSEKSLETLDLDEYDSRFKERMSITSKI